MKHFTEIQKADIIYKETDIKSMKCIEIARALNGLRVIELKQLIKAIDIISRGRYIISKN